MIVTIKVEDDKGLPESAATTGIPSILLRELDLVLEQRNWRLALRARPDLDVSPETRAEVLLAALSLGVGLLIDTSARERAKDAKKQAHRWLFGA